ncbi:MULTISPECIES: class I SAM-dependent methyltransferase [Burkholderia]|uniref:class I SAM-dependent methyltransferase n=1 Tax=Burkholderia TaxID=32008 RepID=UPI0003280E24|nr:MULTISPECIES: class I SAM-dependent methyltransferase [Burkholderia]AGK50510.1 methyltransferase domain protein [Burkholderia thailandensis MSMB121]ATF33619.1 class I SAM-dependent methyltransferase [Burkholderia thailandensis]KST71700.1 methyltransferase [Burkholderia humptydooensis]KVN03150.1 methyltransferase [Burkholderia sp. MSMB1552]KWZ49809.1 methyltransferase [Burkholderia sp. MSMB1588]
MSPDAYLQMAATETTHWWFRARRDILRALLVGLGLPAGARILEIGSGTGGNLGMLEAFGAVSALEMDDTARAIANRRTGWRFDIRAGRCPDDVPFGDQRFDLICFFDCLEHIEDDAAALRRVSDYLAPGGAIVVTVPAYQWLWSAHDTFLHHYRRYDRAALERCARAADCMIVRSSYFNTLLFPLAVVARTVDRLLHRARSSGDALGPRAVNAALYRIFRTERGWLPKHSLPFGVSLFAVLTKRSEPR